MCVCFTPEKMGLTYDQLLLRAKQLLGLSDPDDDEEDYDSLPF